MEFDIEEIADGWINSWSEEKVASVGEDVSDSTLDWELPRKYPNECLDAILKVLEKIESVPENRIFGVLAAGPLEELLVENGVNVFERVDELARRNPEFRRLLNGVWFNSVDDSVTSKLNKYLGNRW